MNEAYHIPPFDLAREDMFWMRIFRDHCQFIMGALAPDRTGLISQAQQFYQAFDRLLSQAGDTSAAYVNQAAQTVARFRVYKLGMVDLQLRGEVPINLPPGALDEMLDEDDEYLWTLKFMSGELRLDEAAFLIHQHLMWLPNNAAHAALLRAQLDPGEAGLFDVYDHYHGAFQSLADKVMELNGLMRDNPRLVPSLMYTTRESADLTEAFKRSLDVYRDQRSTAQVLAINPPLVADHFAREAMYYLEKIGFGAWET